MVNEDVIKNVRNSFGRCTFSQGFLDDFYDNFLAKDPIISEKFKNTDFVKQKEALKSGLGFLILFAKDHSVATRKLRELGESHNKKHLDISPDLYPHWEKALMETVEKHDKQLDFDLKRQWHEVISIGINYIKGQYDK